MGTAALDYIFTGMAGEKVLHTRSREYVVDEIWKWIFHFMGTQIFLKKLALTYCYCDVGFV